MAPKMSRGLINGLGGTVMEMDNFAGEARISLIGRLRFADISGHGKYCALVREAADEIERLAHLASEPANANVRLSEENDRLLDILKQWQWAERNEDAEELNNARKNRDLELKE